jgi:hypothetical protein
LYGAPPGGDPYGAPPGGGAFGASPVAGAFGAPPGGPPPQDYGMQMGGAAQQPGFLEPAQYPGGQQPYPGAGPMMQQPGGFPGVAGVGAGGPPKQFMITLLLCLFGGYFGAHRFYSGHILFGVIQFFTGGGCGIWWAIDLFLIVTGKYTDSQGRPLAKG